MNSTNIVWPELQLTDEERRSVGHYADQERPGVLPRVSQVTLVDTTLAGEASVLAVPFVPSGRRTKIHSITFSGDLELWAVKLEQSSGEQLFGSGFIPVPSLTNLHGMIGMAGSPDFSVSQVLLTRQPMPAPLRLEPALQLDGAQGLIVTGQFTAPGGGARRSVLNIAFHYWEFPFMGTRSAQKRGA